MSSAAQEVSAYQAFKIWVAGYVPLDRDTMHVLIGLGFLAAAVLFSRGRPSVRPFLAAFVLALLLGVAMELADRRDDIRSMGFWRWRASALDVGRTVVFPLAGVLFAWVRTRGRAT